MSIVADNSYPVPPEVGKVGKESPTFIQPVSERSDGIKSFFNKQSPAKKVKDETKMTAGPLEVKSESHEASSIKSGNAVKQEIKEEQKADPEGIKSVITPTDEEKGLGDDSNAPNTESVIKIEDEVPSNSETVMKEEAKDEKVADAEEEKEDLSTTLTKRKRDEKGGAGQRTKVIRREDDSKSAVGLSSFTRLSPPCYISVLRDQSSTLLHHLSHLSWTDVQQPAITNFFKSPGKPKTEEVPPRRASSRKKK